MVGRRNHYGGKPLWWDCMSKRIMRTVLPSIHPLVESSFAPDTAATLA